MTASQDSRSAISKIRLLHGLDQETLQLLQERLVLENYTAGQDLCVEGTRGDRMFIIDSGEVQVLKNNEGGVPVEVATLRPGDIAGEIGLLGDMVRSATLRAKTETTAWALRRDDFQELLNKYPSLSRALLDSISTHLARENTIVARLLSRGGDGRCSVAFFDTKPYMKSVFSVQNKDRFSIQFLEPRLTGETVSLAAGCNVACIFVNDTADSFVLEELKAMGVEMIALRCAGFNNVDLKVCRQLDMSVARVPAYSPHAVAEHAVALIMALNRKIHRAHSRIREGNFSLHGLVGFDMYGKTVGVVGTGKIGKCAAAILRGFGCRIIACDTFQDNEFARQLEMEYVDLDTLFSGSDIITLHAPLLPETFHMIDSAAIEKMKKGIMLINTSRGALIDTQALIEGLKSGKIGYAGLDVYEEESAYFFEDLSDRVIDDDLLARLTTFNNVIVSSHQAFLTEEALTAIAETTLENIQAFVDGRRGTELPNSCL